MSQRKYYSGRRPKTPRAKIGIGLLRALVASVFSEFEQKGYFQEAIGYHCVDEGDVVGTMGADIEAYFFRALRKPNLYPIQSSSSNYSRDDGFDVIELLFDHVSKPIDGHYHGWDNCGWHYYNFDKETGQRDFGDAVNDVLRDYGRGYELSADGEIIALADTGLRPLLEQELAEHDPENVERRVDAAIRKFRHRNSTVDDRRDAVKSLADVLEFLRPKLKSAMLKKDEADLFNIANNFGVRHHNRQQKTGYEARIWLTWMFYVYLATIHAVVRVLARTDQDAR